MTGMALEFSALVLEFLRLASLYVDQVCSDLAKEIIANGFSLGAGRGAVARILSSMATAQGFSAPAKQSLEEKPCGSVYSVQASAFQPRLLRQRLHKGVKWPQLKTAPSSS